ncbi:MAG: transcription termination/antitermination protein NusG [Anaerolineales bacterium]
MDMQENEEQLDQIAADAESEDALQDTEAQVEEVPQAELEDAPEAVESEPEEAPDEAAEEDLPEEEPEQEVPEDEESEEEVLEEEVPEEEEPEEEVPEDEPEMEAPAAEQKFALPEKDQDQEEDRYAVSSLAASEPVKDDGRAWYVIHCYSGNEDKVRHNILQRIESMTMDDLIFDVVVPTEDEVNIKNGERQTVEKKVFPGYILVNMILTEESWYMVRNTPGVTGFVGMGNDPTALQPEEVARILKRMESESPRINVTFRQGERVRIVDGPFEDFYGKVAEIDMERATVRVMVNFFGRETPVELDFLQVEEA